MTDTVIKINKQTCKARTIQDWYFRAGPNTVVKTGGQNIVSHVEKKISNRYEGSWAEWIVETPGNLCGDPGEFSDNSLAVLCVETTKL